MMTGNVQQAVRDRFGGIVLAVTIAAAAVFLSEHYGGPQMLFDAYAYDARLSPDDTKILFQAMQTFLALTISGDVTAARVAEFSKPLQEDLMRIFPVESMDDLAGKKIRTVQNPVHVATFTAFGANATAIAYPEVYGALQTGVVDGGDAANTNYYTAKFYEVAPYWAQVSWLFYSNPLVMSEDAFQALSPEDQEIFQRVGRQVGREQIANWKASDAGLLDELKKAGVTVTTPPREPFQEAVGEVYDTFLASDFEKEWLGRIQDTE